MIRHSRHADGSVLARLREGPLPTSAAHECAADAASLKVTIHKLREAGFIIESEPDPDRRTKTGKPNLRAVRYVLKSEPSPKGPS